MHLKVFLSYKPPGGLLSVTPVLSTLVAVWFFENEMTLLVPDAQDVMSKLPSLGSSCAEMATLNEIAARQGTTVVATNLRTCIISPPMQPNDVGIAGRVRFCMPRERLWWRPSPRIVTS